MLTGSRPAAKPDLRGRTPDAVRARPRLLPEERGPVVISAEQTRPPAWIAEMKAIRDLRDQAAFASLFEYFAPRVKAYLIKSGSAPDMAEEVTQDVMATVWRKAEQFDPARASVSTWVYTIARNRRIDIVRRNRRPEPEDLPWGPEAEPAQDEELALQQDAERLSEALQALPEKQRVLVERAYFGELTHSQIAEETGLPLGTIKSRIRLALDRLRHEMREETG
ncbi:sigma-70 family RNA polymerase sigma factor [Histidinibacterium aquaticum]|uniref:Sigma-70 family RNA polymerase sigma factor n=2 Tax=Histidinibacterium aquaticum TaxID=2613962 RepID=A0A5J5GCY7_9RHOB|nr:sigma-70 family RNA polymerase sigma factor [Histidinibacterium aquaticum]